MDKSKLRQKSIEYLNTISPTKKEEIERKIVDNVLVTRLWRSANTIGITISQGLEWNTKLLIEAAWKQGKQIVIPKCFSNGKKMAFYHFSSYNDLENVYMDLWEPKIEKTNQIVKKEIDLLIVPGLIFDQSGYRIGFGGGYYDRFLIDFANTTISICSNKQIIPSLPYESFDIPVNFIVTEKGSKKISKKTIIN